jgi:hypothetical protein
MVLMARLSHRDVIFSRHNHMPFRLYSLREPKVTQKSRYERVPADWSITIECDAPETAGRRAFFNDDVKERGVACQEKSNIESARGPISRRATASG